MNFTLTLDQPKWRTVFTIPMGTLLPKGRHGPYHDIIRATQSVTERFACYCWRNETTVFYCGSFAQDYAHENFETNLQGRVHNYLQNHQLDAKTGRKNTNLMVFEKINDALRLGDVMLCTLTFESLHISNDTVGFAAFSTDPVLIHAVEELLICIYRRSGQCEWNRA